MSKVVSFYFVQKQWKSIVLPKKKILQTKILVLEK